MITVAELVAHLQTLDQSLPVLFELFSEYDKMDLDEISVFKASDKRIIERNGRYMRARPSWGIVDEEYVSAVVFPGN